MFFKNSESWKASYWIEMMTDKMAWNYLLQWFLVQYFQNQFSQFSHSVVFNSLQPHGVQHVRLPCPSPTPKACSNTCPSSWWCHPTISSSVVHFSSCLQSFPASGSFLVSQFFTSGGQSIGSFSFVIKFLILQYHHLCRKWLVFLSRIVKLIFLKHLLDQVTLQFEILQWLVCLLNET